MMRYKKRLAGLAVVSLTGYVLLLSYSGTKEEMSKINVKTNPVTKFQSIPKKVAHTTAIVRFISNKTKSYSITCDSYRCQMEHGTKTSNADLMVFNAKSVEQLQIPPHRISGDLWAFRSTEPQWLSVESQSKWDGLFNYSLTYVTDTEGDIYSFADKLISKSVVTNINFSSVKLTKHVKGLWFVSHCTQPKRAQVRSARIEYVLELSQHMQIDVFTRKESCREQLGSLVKKEDPEHPPRLKDYIFYLAFENSLCKDYITEKLWKVLEAPTYTIPVVLGGLSIEEYTKVAPPNSFIHVKNFTSPKALADHLKYVAENDDAFNYYLQWRNKLELAEAGMFTGQLCHLCKLAHEKPAGRWDTFSKDFGSHNCLDISAPSDYCSYYNLSCNKNSGKV